MKLTLDLPDWVSERDLYVMAGTEQVAFVPYSKGELWIKTARCNFCGECCKRLTPMAPFPQTKKPGTCDHLWMNECGLGYTRPWSCSVSDPHIGGKGDEEKWCSIRYEKRPL